MDSRCRKYFDDDDDDAAPNDKPFFNQVDNPLNLAFGDMTVKALWAGFNTSVRPLS